MASDIAVAVYWGGLALLFFFWVYGIVSFARDLRYRVVPGLLRYRREQGEVTERGTGEREADEEDEQHLY